jgi:hypothetical protein
MEHDGLLIEKWVLTQLVFGELCTGVWGPGDPPGESIVCKVPGDCTLFQTGERMTELPWWYGESGDAIDVRRSPWDWGPAPGEITGDNDLPGGNMFILIL